MKTGRLFSSRKVSMPSAQSGKTRIRVDMNGLKKEVISINHNITGFSFNSKLKTMPSVQANRSGRNFERIMYNLHSFKISNRNTSNYQLYHELERQTNGGDFLQEDTQRVQIDRSPKIESSRDRKKKQISFTVISPGKTSPNLKNPIPEQDSFSSSSEESLELNEPKSKKNQGGNMVRDQLRTRLKTGIAVKSKNNKVQEQEKPLESKRIKLKTKGHLTRKQNFRSLLSNNNLKKIQIHTVKDISIDKKSFQDSPENLARNSILNSKVESHLHNSGTEIEFPANGPYEAGSKASSQSLIPKLKTFHSFQKKAREINYCLAFKKITNLNLNKRNYLDYLMVGFIYI